MAEARPEETANAARPLSVLPVDDLPSRPSGVEHVRLLRSQGRRRRRRARAENELLVFLVYEYKALTLNIPRERLARAPRDDAQALK
jgi:hypothetical protein